MLIVRVAFLQGYMGEYFGNVESYFYKTKLEVKEGDNVIVITEKKNIGKFLTVVRVISTEEEKNYTGNYSVEKMKEILMIVEDDKNDRRA